MHFRVRRIFLILTALFIFTTQSVWAFSLISDDSEQIIKDTWDAQTLEQIQDGVVAVPQSVVNNYLQSVLSDYPAIKSAEVSIHPDNRIEANIDTAKSGKVVLEGTITKFVQNKDTSSMTVHIDKKEMVDQPVTSWFFSNMSVGLLTKMFGNPLNDNKYGIKTDIDGNNITIDFKPFIEQSPLERVQVMGNSLVDAVNVDSVSTDEGILYLHTSFDAGNVAFNAIKSFL